MDPQTTKDDDGNEVPYAPIRYKEIIKENYIISKNCNTSYLDVLEMTPREKDYILGFITEEAHRNAEMIKENKAQLEASMR